MEITQKADDVGSDQYTSAEVAQGITVHVLIILQVVLLFVGVLLNVFIAVTFCKKRTMTAPEYFPYLLIVFDILLLLAATIRFTLPVFILIYINPTATRLTAQIELYGKALFYPAVPMTVWMTLAALAERYITLCKPLTGSWQTWNISDRQIAKRIAGIIIIACEVFCVIFYVDWHFVPMETKLSVGYKYGVTYFLMLGLYPLIGFVIPLIIGCVLYVKLITYKPAPDPASEEVALQNRTDGGAGGGHEHIPDQLPRKSSTTAILIIFPMLFLLIPWLISLFQYHLGDDIDWDDTVVALLSTVENTLVMVFASFKFLPYRFAWQEFKENFLRHICCKQ